MQIIQPRLRVVIVSTVANGVNARNAAALGDYVAPGIIGISAISLAPGGDNCNHIALKVQHIVVHDAVVIQRIGLASVIVDDIQRMAAPGLPHHLTILGNVVIGYAVNGLAIPNTGKVIGVADDMAALGAAGGLDLRHS